MKEESKSAAILTLGHICWHMEQVIFFRIEPHEVVTFQEMNKNCIVPDMGQSLIAATCTLYQIVYFGKLQLFQPTRRNTSHSFFAAVSSHVLPSLATHSSPWRNNIIYQVGKDIRCIPLNGWITGVLITHKWLSTNSPLVMSWVYFFDYLDNNLQKGFLYPMFFRHGPSSKRIPKTSMIRCPGKQPCRHRGPGDNRGPRPYVRNLDILTRGT